MSDLNDGQRRIAKVKGVLENGDLVGKFLRSSLDAEMAIGSPTHVEHGRWLLKNPEVAGAVVARAMTDITSNKMSQQLRESVLHDLTTFTTGTVVWAQLGFPVFNLTLDFFRALLVTDFGDAGDEPVRLPFPAFVVRCPEQLVAGTRHLFVYPVDHKSTDFTAVHEGPTRMTLEADPAAPARPLDKRHRQAYTQWPHGTSLHALLKGKAAPIEATSEVEATATREMGTTIDPSETALARRVLGNLLLYINANGGLPPEKRLGPTVSVEREHNTEPRFRVGRPVKLGPQLRAALAYENRGSTEPRWKLAQRFVVRGHYKRQPHGPGRSLRKTIWVMPFWKGPTDVNEALARTFEVE